MIIFIRSSVDGSEYVLSQDKVIKILEDLGSEYLVARIAKIIDNHMSYTMNDTYNIHHLVFVFIDIAKMNVTFFDFFDKGSRLNVHIFDIVSSDPVKVIDATCIISEEIHNEQNRLMFRNELEAILNYILEDVVKEKPVSFSENSEKIMKTILSYNKSEGKR